MRRITRLPGGQSWRSSRPVISATHAPSCDRVVGVDRRCPHPDAVQGGQPRRVGQVSQRAVYRSSDRETEGESHSHAAAVVGETVAGACGVGVGGRADGCRRRRAVQHRRRPTVLDGSSARGTSNDSAGNCCSARRTIRSRRAGGCEPSWTAGGPCMSTGFAAQTVEGRLVVGMAFYSPLMRSSRSTTPCRP